MFALAEAVDRDERLLETVKVNTTNCLGPCREGPTLVVYPEGTWYGGVSVADVGELVSEHLLHGRPVERLRLREA